jgi:hypothetical protein
MTSAVSAALRWNARGVITSPVHQPGWPRRDGLGVPFF